MDLKKGSIFSLYLFNNHNTFCTFIKMWALLEKCTPKIVTTCDPNYGTCILLFLSDLMQCWTLLLQSLKFLSFKRSVLHRNFSERVAESNIPFTQFLPDFKYLFSTFSFAKAVLKHFDMIKNCFVYLAWPFPCLISLLL